MAEKALKQPDIFSWTGTDKRGIKIKGQYRGSNPNVIKANLRKQGIKPISVRKKSQLFSNATAKKKIIPKDLAVFFRQLATMLSAGVPLVQSFDIIGRGHENAGMQELILQVKRLSPAPALPNRWPSTRSILMTWSSTSSTPASSPVCWKHCSTKSPPTRKKPKS